MLFRRIHLPPFFALTGAMAILVVISACSSQKNATSRATEISDKQQEYYLSTYPDTPVSPILEEVMNSVKRIISTSFYTHYLFEEGSQITRVDIEQDKFKSHAVESRHTNHSTSGTATVIHSDSNKLALISCAHVLDSPDTLYHHYYTEGMERTPFLRSVSIRERRQDLLLSGSAIEEFNIIARDQRKDLVIITVNNTSASEEQIDFSDSPELNIKLGRLDRISLGTLSYILGYPSGRGMVTRSLVSLPRSDTTSHRLWLDALFNPGLSGGLILAFRGDGQSAHWIGLARQTQADSELYLAPGSDINQSNQYDPTLPYRGELYIERSKRLKYGVSEGISSNAIRAFLRNNQTILKQNGIDVGSLLRRP